MSCSLARYGFSREKLDHTNPGSAESVRRRPPLTYNRFPVAVVVRLRLPFQRKLSNGFNILFRRGGIRTKHLGFWQSRIIIQSTHVGTPIPTPTF